VHLSRIDALPVQSLDVSRRDGTTQYKMRTPRFTTQVRARPFAYA
jgi:hypothetical protein